MILRNEYWFDIVPSRGSPAAIAGKWLHFGPTKELHSWLDQLDRLVEMGQLAAVKIARKLPKSDPFPDKPCVMCVFTTADDFSKESAKKVVKNEFGIEVAVWKSEEQTLQDWSPGGWLRVEAEINRLRRRIASGTITQSERARLQGLVQELLTIIDEIKDPSTLSELEHSQASKLANQLKQDLQSEGTSTPLILARLVAIEEALHGLTGKHQHLPEPAAIAAVTEASEEVFVIMPFSKAQLDTYDTIVRGVAKAGSALKVWRVDEVAGSVAITDEIRKAIRRAGLVICDLTEERPNVYYELGLAHGLNKRVVCIARESTTLHFDIYGLKTLFFDTYRSLEEQLGREVGKMLDKDPSGNLKWK